MDPLSLFLGRSGLSADDVIKVVTKLRSSGYEVDDLERFSSAVSIDLLMKLGIPKNKAVAIVYELVKMHLTITTTAQEDAELIEFSIGGPPPGRYPSNQGFLCNKHGFQYVSFADDDFVPRFTRESIVAMAELYCV